MLADARLKLVLENPTKSLEYLAIQGKGWTQQIRALQIVSKRWDWSALHSWQGQWNKITPPSNQDEEVRSKAEQVADAAAVTEKSSANASRSNQKRSPFDPSEPNNSNSAIIQTFISGPGLEAAWLSNKTTKCLEAPSPNWAPSQPSAPYFYHGAAIGADPMKAQSIFSHGLDIGFSQSNKMCTTGAIYTSIYVCRAFLWSMILSTFAALGLSPQQAGKLSQILSVDEKEYRCWSSIVCLSHHQAYNWQFWSKVKVSCLLRQSTPGRGTLRSASSRKAFLEQ